MPSPPTLNLPTALIRLWPGRQAQPAGEAQAAEIVRELIKLPGFAQVGESLYAALPVDGRVSVFDLAARWSAELLSRLDRAGLTPSAPDILIFPGQVTQRGADFETDADFLLRDFERQQPSELPGGVVLTGYAARWLKGRYRFEKAGVYSGPSGRRVPLYRLAGVDADSRPWHNPEILGRRLSVPRPSVLSRLEAGLNTGDGSGLRVRGALGVGKGHAVWSFLEGRREPRVWIGVGRALPGSVTLAKRLAVELDRLAPGLGPASRKHLEGDPESVATFLAGRLSVVRQRLGAPPWLVCDVFQTITRGDLELLSSLLRQDRLEQAARFVLVSRTGRADPEGVEHLPAVEIFPFEGPELGHYRRKLFEGLGMSEEMISDWVEMAAGNPFLLEEGLVGLVHAGRIRRVYGSFFFEGGENTDYEPSQRLVRHVEAEVRRLGEPLPLRFLAASGQAVPAEHLEIAADACGVDLDAGWQEPYLATGWLRVTGTAWGPGLELANPIYARSLNALLATGSRDELRHALGQVMVSDRQTPTGAWHAYRLLAGSPEALPPLLDFSRSGKEHPTRSELFDALLQELWLHQERSGDEASELDLLWSLLPLGHRLGRLRDLEGELRRALELSSERPRKHLALLALHAELELEKGSFRSAEASLRKALAASEGVDENRRAAIFVRLGDLLVREERLKEARELFESLLDVVKQPDSAMAATCHFHLGNISLRQKNIDGALEHHQITCRIRRERSQGKPLGMSLSALGAVHLARGDFPKALRFYREAAEVLERLQAPGELALAQRGAGRVLSLLGNHLEASKLLRRALEASVGRDIVSEALARLEVASNLLELGNVEQALDEARQAHFQLSLTPETAFRGDAEQVLGQILRRQHQREAAQEHLGEARRMHLKHGDRQAAAVDVSQLLELAIDSDDAGSIQARSAELEVLLKDQSHPTFGEVLYYRLYKAADRLRSYDNPARHELALKAPEEYLRRAFQELIRKTSFLEPDQRHVFLFQIREHQDLVNDAASHNLTFPGL